MQIWWADDQVLVCIQLSRPSKKWRRHEQDFYQQTCYWAPQTSKHYHIVEDLKCEHWTSLQFYNRRYISMKFGFKFTKLMMARWTYCLVLTITGTGLSVQQLEALVKMKPSEEEEKKLMDYNGGISILDPAENFVKVLLTIPMAFSRIEAMLYKETFDDEVAHLRMSFTLIKVSGAISIN